VVRNSQDLVVAALLAGILIAAAPARGQTIDHTVPSLVSYSFSPSSFDTSAGPNTVVGSIQATDYSSGLGYAFIAFYSPSGLHRVDCHSNTGGSYTGTSLAGTFSCTATFDRYLESGAWVVRLVSVVDRAGNAAIWDTAQLQARGFHTSLTLNGTSDAAPPTLIGYSFAPAALSLSSNPVMVTGVIQASDDLSGLYHAYIAFYSPSGNQRVDCSSPAGGPTSGSTLSGSFSCNGTFLPGVEAGAWTVRFIYLCDKAGNSVMLPTSQLQVRGLPILLAVSSVADSVPPVLTGYSLSPATVDVAHGPASVSAAILATDNQSGLRGATLAFASPSGAQRVDCVGNEQTFGSTRWQFTCSASFADNSEEGPWTVLFATVTDSVGNVGSWNTGQLIAMGLPAKLSVVRLTLSAPPPSLEFTFQIGNSAPDSRVLSITGTGVPWFASTLNSAPWLSVTPLGGTPAQGLSISVSPIALPPGTYRETITINDPGANYPSVLLPVRLDVAPAIALGHLSSRTGGNWSTGTTQGGGGWISLFWP